MSEENRPSHPGEEDYYSQFPYSQRDKLPDPISRSRGQRLLRILIGIVAILLVVVIVFGFVIVRSWTTSSPISPQPIANTPLQPGTTSIPTSTPSPPPTPTPSPTPTTNPGDVMFESNFNDNSQGWNLGKNWHIGYGQLSCSGDCNGDLTVPYMPPRTDYAFEVTMNASGSVGICLVCGNPSFKVFIHVEKNQSGYFGGVEGGGSDNHAIFGTRDGNTENSTVFNQGGKQNIYRIQFRQGNVSFFINPNKDNTNPIFQPTISNISPNAGSALIRLAGIQDATITRIRIIAT